MTRTNDTRGGRPAVGAVISTAIGDVRLDAVDDFAGRRGLSRAEAIRQLLDAGLAASDTRTVWAYYDETSDAWLVAIGRIHEPVADGEQSQREVLEHDGDGWDGYEAGFTPALLRARELVEQRGFEYAAPVS